MRFGRCTSRQNSGISSRFNEVRALHLASEFRLAFCVMDQHVSAQGAGTGAGKTTQHSSRLIAPSRLRATERAMPVPVQTVDDAVEQYKRDRNPKELGRCIAHFAVDDSEVRFCTQLKGKSSWFLPFNLASAICLQNNVAVWLAQANPEGSRNESINVAHIKQIVRAAHKDIDRVTASEAANDSRWVTPQSYVRRCAQISPHRNRRANATMAYPKMLVRAAYKCINARDRASIERKRTSYTSNTDTWPRWAKIGPCCRREGDAARNKPRDVNAWPHIYFEGAVRRRNKSIDCVCECDSRRSTEVDKTGILCRPTQPPPHPAGTPRILGIIDVEVAIVSYDKGVLKWIKRRQKTGGTCKVRIERSTMRPPNLIKTP